MDFESRPYETDIVADESGAFSLHYISGLGGDWSPVLTPKGWPLVHRSQALLEEIQSEFKSATPKQILERFSNYQLLCSQIDEFENGTHDADLSVDDVAEALKVDGAFFSMHPPEEVERLYNLDCLSRFLESHFGERWLGTFLVSSPVSTRAIWGRHDSEGDKFEELRDELHYRLSNSSLEQQVVIHSAIHMCASLTLSILLAYGEALPKEFSLGAMACQQIIPDILEEDEQKESLDYQDKLALYASIMASYLERSRTNVERMIEQGEGLNVEFKSTFRRNLHTSKNDKEIETAALKEVVAFLNTDGGHLIIGIADNGDVCGLGNDGFSSEDRYTTHISNQLSHRVGADYGKYLTYVYEKVRGEQVLDLVCDKLPSNEMAFLDGELYIRNAAQAIKLSTKEAIEWQNRRG